LTIRRLTHDVSGALQDLSEFRNFNQELNADRCRRAEIARLRVWQRLADSLLVSGLRRRSDIESGHPELRQATVVTYDRPGVGQSEIAAADHGERSAKTCKFCSPIGRPKPISWLAILREVLLLFASMYPKAGRIGLGGYQHEDVLTEMRKILEGKTSKRLINSWPTVQRAGEIQDRTIIGI